MRSPPSQLRPRRAHPRKGLTLVELSLGLVITSIMGLAIVSLSTAIGSAWSNEAARGTSTTAEDQLRARATIEREIERALAVGYASGIPTASPNPAYLVLWANDDLPTAASNGLAELYELRLIEASPADGRIYLWVAEPWSTASAGQRATLGQLLAGQFTTADVVPLIKTSGAFVRHRIFPAGDGDVDITAAGFAVTRTDAALSQTVARYEIATGANSADQTLSGVVLRHRSDQDTSGGGN